MLAHEPLVQMLEPSLATLIAQGAAGGRAASPWRRSASPAAIRAQDAAQAEDWMSKHIRDFRRGFEIAGIGLERRVGND